MIKRFFFSADRCSNADQNRLDSNSFYRALKVDDVGLIRRAAPCHPLRESDDFHAI